MQMFLILSVLLVVGLLIGKFVANRKNNIALSIFMILFSFLMISPVMASSIDKIEMDVYIDKDGNANITETWKVYLREGTEGYRAYTKLDDSEIFDFTVSDESGKQYKQMSWWDTSASFEEKAYKNGIHRINDGVELCWGISKYGNKTFTLKYKISNFVTQYKDKQGIYFNFLDLDLSIEQAKVTIHSEQEFSSDNTKIWGFGNDGTTTFENGKIVLNSNGFLSSSQYMVGLIKFEDNLFNTNSFSRKSFDDIYDSAMSDVQKDEFDTNSYTEKNYDNFSLFSVFDVIGTVIYRIIFTVSNLLLFGIFIFVIIKARKSPGALGSKWPTFKRLDFGVEGNTLPSDDKIDYWREIPCGKDLTRAYWVARNYGILSKSESREGIIGAILLKWIKEGLITIVETPKGLFSFKDNNYAIDFNNVQVINNSIENGLLTILKDAAGINKILEAKEFGKWCKKHYSVLQKWFDRFEKVAQLNLEQQKLIMPTQMEKTGIFGIKLVVTVKKVSAQLREEAIQLKGLKKFLLDYSRISQREAIEVRLWEEYLIYAQLLGIADKVEEQFSRIYPDFNQETKLNTEITMTVVRDVVYYGYRGYEEGIRIEKSRDNRDSSRDSGAGGSSYSSGGTSSGGSSGGGFR